MCSEARPSFGLLARRLRIWLQISATRGAQTFCLLYRWRSSAILRRPGRTGRRIRPIAERPLVGMVWRSSFPSGMLCLPDDRDSQPFVEPEVRAWRLDYAGRFLAGTTLCGSGRSVVRRDPIRSREGVLPLLPLPACVRPGCRRTGVAAAGHWPRQLLKPAAHGFQRF